MDSVFHPAIASLLTGDLEELRLILQADPTLARRRSSCGHPTLLQMIACEAKHLRDPVGAASLLMEAGADVGEPLVAAASVDAREVLLHFLEQGAPVDGTGPWTPLDEALYWRHLDLAAMLVARGASARSLRAAAGLGDVEAVARFFDDGGLRPEAGPIRSPFQDTVPPERANAPQDILDNGLVMAAQNGHRGVAFLLRSKGARVNVKPPGFHWRGAALHAAVWHGDEDMVTWLIAQGANPALRDDMVGADAAGWANHHGHAALLRLLESP